MSLCRKKKKEKNRKNLKYTTSKKTDMLRSVQPSYFYSVATLSFLDLLTFLVPHVVHYLKLGRLVPSTNPCHPKADKFHKIQLISLKLAPVRANCKYLTKKVSKFCCISFKRLCFQDHNAKVHLNKYMTLQGINMDGCCFCPIAKQHHLGSQCM